MNLNLKFRDRLYALGSWFVQELDQAVASIRASWDPEHHDDGTHGDITATKLTVRKGTPQEIASGIKSGEINTDAGVTAATTGKFGGDVTADLGQVLGPIRIGLVGNTALNDAVIGSGTDMKSIWMTNFSDFGGAVDRRYVITDLATGMTPVMVRRDAGGNYYLQPGPVSKASGMLAWLGNPNDSFGNGFWDGVYAKAYYRNSLTVAEGEWQDEAFVAGNFTASAGTWTLTAPDQVLFRYTLIGKTMIIDYVFDTTSVSAAPAQLRFLLPGGKIAAKDTYATCFYNDNLAGWVNNGNAVAQAGVAYIGLQPGALGVGAWTVSVNQTYVRGVFTVEVQ